MSGKMPETLHWEGRISLDGKRYAIFSNAEHQLRIMAITDLDDGGERHEVMEPVTDAALIARIKNRWQQR
jgi:hypothetical protein